MNTLQSNAKTRVSSRLGRLWLAGTRKHEPDSSPIAPWGDDDSIPDAVSVAPDVDAADRVQLLSVSIPDVSSLPASIGPAAASIGGPDSQSIARSLAEASEQKLSQLRPPIFSPTAESGKTLQPPIASKRSDTLGEATEPVESWVEKTDLPQRSRGVERQTSQPDETEGPEERREPSDQEDRSATDGDPASKVAPAADTNWEQPLAAVVESIGERFEGGRPLLLTFSGSDTNRHIERTARTVSGLLASRGWGRVLLIDADPGSRRLSRMLRADQQDGWLEALDRELPWTTLVCPEVADGADFLPAGRTPATGVLPAEGLPRLVEQLRDNYSLICVAAGACESELARQWSAVSDGCYLLVSQTQTHPELAKSGIAELRSGGARLLGCIVTDAES